MNRLKLPHEYNLIYLINLTKDRKTIKALALGILITFVITIIIGYIISPANAKILSLRNFILLIIGYPITIIVHELIHGLFIKITSGFKVEYGFNWSYAYAGNKDAYFNKISYIIIALSPVLVLSIIFIILIINLPPSLFWALYILNALNISGSIGDFYMTYLTMKMPKDVLVNDSGFEMKFYSSMDQEI